ncbi:MAG: flagellar basal body-associated FliL family protein [Candidatus Aureabacteria bacterium]|nr:flagellar basal body-associated FliL family protein [Candidatus Auribacterota bacterium]
MGEEEKAAEAAPAPDAGGGEATPDVGAIPGGFAPTGAGRGIFLSMRLLFILVPVSLVVIISGFYGSYYFGKMQSLFREGLIRKSNKYMGPVYPVEEIKTNIINASLGIDTSITAAENNKNILELKINLVLGSDESIEEINKRYPEIVDHLFTLVHKKSYEDLDSFPDQNKFKRQIRDELNNLLSRPLIKEVFFEKFRIVPLKPVQVINWDEKKP